MIKALIYFLLAIYSQAWSLSCSTPVTVSDPKVHVQCPYIYSNPQGDVAITWPAETDYSKEYVQIVTKMAQDANWSKPVTVSSVNDQVTPSCFIDIFSNAYAIWEADNPHTSGIPMLFAMKRVGETWSLENTLTPEHFIPSSAGFYNDGKIAIIGSYYTWTYPYHKSVRIYTKTTDQLMPIAIDLAIENEVDRSVLAINKSNRAFAAWSTSESLFYARELIPNHWSSPVKLCNLFRGENNQYQITADAYDQPTIVWEFSTYNQDSSVILAMSQQNGIWSDPFIISNPHDIAVWSKMCIDDQGNVLVVWEARRENSTTICTAYKPVNQLWMKSVDISLSNRADFPEISSDNKGHFVVVWREENSNCLSVHGAVFDTVSQSWTSPSLLSPKNQFCNAPAIAFSKDGKGIVTWETKLDEIHWSIQAATLTVD